MKKILVVDDEPEICRLLKMLLTKEKYEVITAPNGEEALKILNSTLFDLMILDMLLPGIGGYEIIKQVRDKSLQKLLPIMIISGNTSKEDEIAALNAGADYYVRKPFENNELLARIRVLLKRAGTK